MKKLFWNKFLTCLTSISLLVNSLLPYNIATVVYAQDSIDQITVTSEEVTTTNTPFPTITETFTPEPTPTDTPKPTTEATSSATPIVLPTPTPEPASSSIPEPTTEATSSATPTIEPVLGSKLVSVDSEKIPLRNVEGFFTETKKSTIKNYVEGEVIVKFKTNKVNVKSILGKVQAFVFEKKFSLEKKDEIKSSNIQVFKSKKSTEEMVKELKLDSNVEYVQPNYIYEPTTINTNDTYKDLLWGLDNINDNDIDAPEAWGVSEGNGTIVAVIDSGVAYNHLDLINSMWDGSFCKDESGVSLGGCNHGFDFENNDNSPLPDNSSHGTHIAGTIAAEINNGRGIIGVAPKTKIMAIKTSLTTSDNVKSINFARENGAKIINASWGCYGSDQGGGHLVCGDYDGIADYHDTAMIDAISNFPGLFITAAGNGDGDTDYEGDNHDSGDTLHSYPCGHTASNIICVAATDQDDDMALFSDYGSTSVDVGAPGVDIYSTGFMGENFKNALIPNFTNTIFTKTSGSWKTGTWGDFGGNTNNINAQANSTYVNNDTGVLTLTVPVEEMTLGAEVFLNYYLYLSTETPSSNGCYDFLAIEVDNNDDNWVRKAGWCGTGEGSMSDSVGPATTDMRVRFVWYTDGSVIGTQVPVIDDIEITNTLSYQYMDGTSMAAPHVAGLAALIWGYKPNLTLDQVKDRILQTGDSLDSLNGKTSTGRRINAFEALDGLNNPPITSNGLATVDEDESVVIDLSGSDIDGDSLTYSVVFGVAHGVLGTISGNKVTYTPNTNYFGSDSFTFKANDATTDSNVATVTINIDPINDFPILSSVGNKSIDELTNLNFTAVATDPDGLSLTYSLTSAPTGASISSDTGVFSFTPTEVQGPGEYTFSINVTDGIETDSEEIKVTVNEVNLASVAQDGSVSTNEDTAKEITLVATDSDIPTNTLTYSIVDTASHGTVSLIGDIATYTPNTDYNGGDSFTYEVNDGVDDSNIATISITVNSINDGPIANPDSATINEDETFTVAKSALLSNDTDVEGNTLTLMSVSNPVHGSVEIGGDNVVFTPVANYFGSASFDYTISDGDQTSTTTVSITINSVNNDPVANSQSVSTDEDTSVEITLSASDVDEDSLTYSLVGLPSNGTLSEVSGNLVTYTPNTNYTGEDSFTFEADDTGFLGTTSLSLFKNPLSTQNSSFFKTFEFDPIVLASVSTNTATISITINPINDAPVANPDTASVDEDNDLVIAKTILLSNDTDTENDSLILTAVSNPINGTVVINGDNVVFTPTPNYFGSASFDYTISDGALTGSSTVNIVVNSINDAPELDHIGNKNIDEFSTLSFTVSAIDIDGSSLNYTTSILPNNATFNGDNQAFSFTPDESQGGQDYQVTFTVSDGILTDDETITITVNEVNSSPVAVDDTASVNEDEVLTVDTSTLLTNDYDLDTNTNAGLTVTAVNTAINGSVGLVGSTITFTPDTNFNGSASFDYIVSDGSLTDTGTVNITIDPINDQPKAENSVATTDEDTLITINLSASDIDNDNLSYSVVSGVSHGVLNNLNNNQIDYTPSTDYFGTDSFTFKANDGLIDSNVATVTITVTALNDPPVLDPVGSKSVDELTTLSFTVSATDPDNTLIYSLANEPTGATINSNSGEFSFTPIEVQGPNNYTLTINVTDGTNTDSEEITITVNEVNVAPVAIDNTVSTNEDTSKTITLGATDSDLPANILNYSIVSGVSNGVLGAITDNQITYTPSTDYNGIDSFTFKANDGTVNSNTATISITINAVNDAPIANPDTASVDEDNDLVIAKSTLLLNDTDLENDSLTLTSISDFINGSAVIDGDSVVFTPTTNYFGSASFDYTISDGELTSSSTVNITIDPVNDAPITNDGSQTTNEDTLVTIDLSGSDIENDSLSYFIVSGVSNGVLGTISGSQVNYTPNTNYNGSDSFTFKVNDGGLDSNTATISITISPVNDAPILNSIGNKSVDELATLSFTATATDPDSSLTYSLANEPTGSTIDPNTGVFSFTPTESQGPNIYTLIVSVTDGTETDSEEITITVNEVNMDPVALDGKALTDEDTVVEITLNATDSDVPTNTLTYSIVSGVGNGVLGTISGNQLTYTPSADYNGIDSFTFKANDGTVDSNTVTVTINIDPVNDKPVATPDTASVDEDTVLTIAKTILLSNDTDVDGDLLTLSSVSNPVNGSVVIDGNNVKFTLTANYFGSASFDYIVTDGILTDSASVTITVNPVNDSPIANDSTVIASQDTPVTIDLSASDVDGDTLTYSINTGVSNGVLGAVSDNQVVYTPDSGYAGSDSFTFLVNDGNIDSNVATVNITINLPPVISDEATDTPGERSITITWTTDHPSTSRVVYDTVSHTTLDVAPNYGYANSTIEADNSPKVTSHTVTINGLTAGTSYFYRVVSHGSPEVVGDEKSFTTKSATTSGGEVAGTSTSSSSSFVCNDQKPGSAPILVSAVSYGPNEITLTWSKAKDPVTYYLLTFGNKSGEMLYGNPSVGGSDTTSYTVRGLSAGSRYYFKVRAGNSCMPGDFSNELSATVYGETFTQTPEGFLPDVLGEETTTEEVLGDEASITQSQEPTGLSGGSTRGNIVLYAGIGIILLSTGYFFFIKRKRR